MQKPIIYKAILTCTLPNNYLLFLFKIMNPSSFFRCHNGLYLIISGPVAPIDSNNTIGFNKHPLIAFTFIYHHCKQSAFLRVGVFKQNTDLHNSFPNESGKNFCSWRSSPQITSKNASINPVKAFVSALLLKSNEN